MKLGVCYYPEQWPQERWAVDARLMRSAGIKLVRIADFAWSLMEPRENEFSWDWLDRAIDTLAAEGLEVILCTPTASPPPWLSRSYPDTLPVDNQGRTRRHGSRRHYCVSSQTYHRHTQRIVAALAARYGHHPAVIGWQIDNEFGCHYSSRCYCENCAAAFRSWLETKYHSIAALNAAWDNVFWSQVYNDWSEIDPPNLTVADPNPAHVLDYDRFSSDSFVSYQQLQIDAIRPYLAANQLVTTNYMSRFTDIDYYALARPLDLVSMSSYPTGHAESPPSPYMPGNTRPTYAYDVGDPYLTGFGQALMRGFKPQRPFWVMEQQCGHVNWGVYNTGVRPGTVRLWTWQALASGAEAVVYFRWRAGLFAQEQLHSGLLHHDASPDVGYGELQSMQSERPLMAEIPALPQTAPIALLFDYDSIWAQRLQPHRRELDGMRHLFLYYRALQRLGLPAEIVSNDADLSQYKLVIAPNAFIVTEQLARSLQSFAEAGGTVVCGVRSGFKTPENQVTDQPLPGALRDLFGVTVTDWHALPPGIGYELQSEIPALAGSATVWAEAFKPLESAGAAGESTLQTLATYRSGPFNTASCLVSRPVGFGQALYLGWYPDDRQAEAFLAYLAAKAGIAPLAALPEGLLASRHGAYLILLNFMDEPQTAMVQGQAVTVGGRDVKVLKTLE